MISFKNCSLIDSHIFRLIKKLPQDICPAESLLLDLKGGYLKVAKVLVNKYCVGILVYGEGLTRTNLKEFTCYHAIAEDGLEGATFTEIMRASVKEWVFGQGFESLRVHASNRGLKRLLESIFGEPVEWVFQIQKG